jgi:polyphosphate kinase 2 (PPK2 family)
LISKLGSKWNSNQICHATSGVNPQGYHVFSFEQPISTELEHDFLLWTTLHLLENGKIAIFDRSYYEEVLIDRGKTMREILARSAANIVFSKNTRVDFE